MPLGIVGWLILAVGAFAAIGCLMFGLLILVYEIAHFVDERHREQWDRMYGPRKDVA